MTAKTSAARQQAFLKALAQSGNQALAAERARVSRSWVTLHRSRDAEFDTACRAAITQAAAALLASGARRTATGEVPCVGARMACAAGSLSAAGTQPVGGRRYQAGEELIVRGTGGGVKQDRANETFAERLARPRRVQIARARLKQWTPRTEQTFLKALGETANVKMACAAAGLSPASAYNHRKRWEDFARRWHAVLAETIDRLEAALLERGVDPAKDPDLPECGPIRNMTASEALYMLTLFRRWQQPRVDRGIASREELVIKLGRLIASKKRQSERLERAANAVVRPDGPDPVRGTRRCGGR